MATWARPAAGPTTATTTTTAAGRMSASAMTTGRMSDGIGGYVNGGTGGLVDDLINNTDNGNNENEDAFFLSSAAASVAPNLLEPTVDDLQCLVDLDVLPPQQPQQPVPLSLQLQQPCLLPPSIDTLHPTLSSSHVIQSHPYAAIALPPSSSSSSAAADPAAFHHPTADDPTMQAMDAMAAGGGWRMMEPSTPFDDAVLMQLQYATLASPAIATAAATPFTSFPSSAASAMTQLPLFASSAASVLTLAPNTHAPNYPASYLDAKPASAQPFLHPSLVPFSEQCFAPLNQFSLLPPTQLQQKNKASAPQPVVNKRKSFSVEAADPNKRTRPGHLPPVGHTNIVADHVVVNHGGTTGVVACIHMGSASSRLNCSIWENVDVASSIQPSAALTSTMRQNVARMALQDTSAVHKVVVQTPAVTQKSYGSEKRFICPGPTIDVSLPGVDQEYIRQTTASIVPLVSVNSIEHSSGVCRERQTHDRTHAYSVIFKSLYVSEQRSSASDSPAIDDDLLAWAKEKTGFGLHSTTSAKKEKKVTIYFRFADDMEIPSTPLNLISKPARRTKPVAASLAAASPRPQDALTYGSRIALFNRIRNQSVSTKFLGLYTFEATASQDLGVDGVRWESFVIRCVQASPGSPEPPGPPADDHDGESVWYNSHVVLEQPERKYRSPVFIVRRVDPAKNGREDWIVTREPATGSLIQQPVTQLHKIALEYRDVPGTFLAFHTENERVNYAPNFAVEQDGKMVVGIKENATWSIVGIRQSEFQWVPGLAMPMPLVDVTGVATIGIGQAYPPTPFFNEIVPRLISGSGGAGLGTKLELNLQIPISAMLHVMSQIKSSTAPTIAGSMQTFHPDAVLRELLDFDVFLGNVCAPILTNQLEKYEKSSDSEYFHVRLVAQFPSWQCCLRQGGWWKNLPLPASMFSSVIHAPPEAPPLSTTTTTAAAVPATGISFPTRMATGVPPPTTTGDMILPSPDTVPPLPIGYGFHALEKKASLPSPADLAIEAIEPVNEFGGGGGGMPSWFYETEGIGFSAPPPVHHFEAYESGTGPMSVGVGVVNFSSVSGGDLSFGFPSCGSVSMIDDVTNSRTSTVSTSSSSSTTSSTSRQGQRRRSDEIAETHLTTTLEPSSVSTQPSGSGYGPHHQHPHQHPHHQQGQGEGKKRVAMVCVPIFLGRKKDGAVFSTSLSVTYKVPVPS